MRSSKKMKCIKNVLFGVMGAFCMANANAVQLSGVATVNITSDTANTAKTMAFDEARRQIIMDALGQYSNPEQLREVLANAASDDLTALVSTSAISGEKISNTTYSATISMTLDANAVRQWMNVNAVQNWLPDGNSGDKFVVLATLSNPLVDWIDLNHISRAGEIDFSTKYMMGDQIMMEFPNGKRAGFTISLRESGWKYADQDGVLRIWK